MLSLLSTKCEDQVLYVIINPMGINNNEFDWLAKLNVCVCVHNKREKKKRLYRLYEFQLKDSLGERSAEDGVANLPYL